MKKVLLLLSISIFAFFIFTGQKTQDSQKWNIPQTHVYFSGTSSPYLPTDYPVPVNTKIAYINSPSGISAVGPNFRPFPHTATQSEVEAFANPNVPGKIIAGWNSYSPSFYGTGFAITTNTGVNWVGSYELSASLLNGGDPSVIINSSGKVFMNALNSAYTGVVHYGSTDNGTTWTGPFTVASSSSEDKNHVYIDDKSTSPYYNYQYCAWTDFSGSTWPAKFSRSTDGGTTWQTAVQITTPLSGHYSQGVNINTAPNGDVYMICAEPLTTGSYTEDYICFAKSTNGGQTFTANEQAIDVNGIRGNLKSTAIRVNSFPWMAVDKTGGLYNGNIYIVWAQKSLAPAGSDPDICFAKSTNGGTSFSTPVRVNQDPINNGRDQYFGNICVDASGGINIDYYDSRNPTTNDTVEVYLSRSIDGGNTFTDTKISDHRFKPAPISGLAGGYQGDYIGIAYSNNAVYPFWADNSSGIYQVWTAKIDLGPSIAHTPLTNTEQTTGTRAVTCTITPAGSGINPSLTRLYYRLEPTTTWTLVQLTNSSGTNWAGNITMGGAGTYDYYLTTTDSMSRVATAPAGAPAAYYMFTASADTVKPVIVTTPLPNTPKTSWPATVTATVTDNIGVDSAWVRLYINNPTTVKRFKLTNTSGSTYAAAFNSVMADVNPGDSIFYRIIAQDISSNHNRDSTALYKFKIINQVTACIGSGTTASDYPFGTYWEDGRTQLLYLSSEIVAAGGASGFIQSIGFNVQSVGGPAMSGFNIRMQNTSVSTISAWTSSNWTTCYSGTYTVAATGWQYITLTTPFYWTSGQNLLMEICYNNNSWTAYSPVNASTATGLMIGYEMDLPSGDGCTEPTWTASALAYRDNICMLMNPGPNAIGNSNMGIPNTFKLSQNYPNPFNPTTKIEYALPKNGLVSLKIYDVLGREVRNLVNETKVAGYYSVDFNASDLSSGVYFYKLEANGFSDIKKMMLIK